MVNEILDKITKALKEKKDIIVIAGGMERVGMSGLLLSESKRGLPENRWNEYDEWLDCADYVDEL